LFLASVADGAVVEKLARGTGNGTPAELEQRADSADRGGTVVGYAHTLYRVLHGDAIAIFTSLPSHPFCDYHLCNNLFSSLFHPVRSISVTDSDQL